MVKYGYSKNYDWYNIFYMYDIGVIICNYIMQYPSYKIAQFASDYEKGNASTQQEFLSIVKKEILSNLQNYVKKSAEELDAKVLEYQQKLLDAIKKWQYDNADVKKWIANKITPLARSYAQELANNLKKQK